MRDSETINEELLEISMIQDDMTRLERIIAWSAIHPDEIPTALRFFRSGRSAGLDQWIDRHSANHPHIG